MFLSWARSVGPVSGIDLGWDECDPASRAWWPYQAIRIRTTRHVSSELLDGGVSDAGVVPKPSPGILLGLSCILWNLKCCRQMIRGVAHSSKARSQRSPVTTSTAPSDGAVTSIAVTLKPRRMRRIRWFDHTWGVRMGTEDMFWRPQGNVHECNVEVHVRSSRCQREEERLRWPFWFDVFALSYNVFSFWSKGCKVASVARSQVW